MWNPSVNSSRVRRGRLGAEGGSALRNTIPERYRQGTIEPWRQNLTGGYGPNRLRPMTNKDSNDAR